MMPGVVSKEFWKILDADEALEWVLLGYTGAASTAVSFLYVGGANHRASAPGRLQGCVRPSRVVCMGRHCKHCVEAADFAPVTAELDLMRCLYPSECSVHFHMVTRVQDVAWAHSTFSATRVQEPFKARTILSLSDEILSRGAGSPCKLDSITGLMFGRAPHIFGPFSLDITAHQ
eukprot:1160675-Pelagomonas_calceolata.AAC.18